MKSYISRIFLSIFAVINIQLVAWAQTPPGNISIAASASNNYDIPPSQSSNVIHFDVSMTSLSDIFCYGYDFALNDQVNWSTIQTIPCNTASHTADLALDLPRGTQTVYVRLRWQGVTNGNWQAPISSASTSVTLTRYYSVAVQNSFSAGNVKVDGGTYATGTSFTWVHGSTHTLEALDNQFDGTYYEWFHDWSNGPSSLSQTITISQNAIYQANFNKDFNITFQNSLPGGSGGVIKVNGTQYNAPTSTFVVRQPGTITGEGLYQVIDNIEYTFSSWSSGGSTSASTTFTPGGHTTYTSSFSAKPQPPPNLSVGGSVGNHVQITWSQHPSSGVTQYQIWRKVKHAGQSEGSPELLTTVGSSTTSYTDNEYLVTSGYTNDLVWYDIRAYFSPTSTYADPNFLSAFAQHDNSKLNEDKNRIAMNSSELPTQYKVSSYPNPFNPSTTIGYQLVEQSEVSLKVYDIMGREIASLVSGNKPAGYYSAQWNGRDADGKSVSTGVYLYRFSAIPNSGKQAVLLSGKLLLSK